MPLSPAVCLLAALLPTAPHGTAPAAAMEPAPVFVPLFDFPPAGSPAPSFGQQFMTRSYQILGGTVTGAVVALGGAIAAVPPALVLANSDSGDVGGGVVVLGAGIGYTMGAAWAICRAGEAIGGCQGSRLMTRLGVGAGIALAGGILGTELIETPGAAVAVGVALPPLTGILAFELSRTAPCVRKEVPESAIALAIVVVGSASIVAYHQFYRRPALEEGRIVVPLLGMRW